MRLYDWTDVTVLITDHKDYTFSADVKLIMMLSSCLHLYDIFIQIEGAGPGL